MKEGIYDQLLTASIRKALSGLDRQRYRYVLEDIEEADSSDYLGRHLVRQVKSLLDGLPAEDRKRRQIELANVLISLANSSAGDGAEADLVENPGELLKAIYSQPLQPERPTTPLGRSSLLMNALDEPRLGFELEREMRTADRVLMLVSFIQWRGWQRLRPAFEELARAGKAVRVLTTTYIGATDFQALKAIAKLPNVELRISLDGRRRRLHAKAWLFERLNGFSSVYVGSANLSGPALEDGIEWTVKLSEVDAAHIVERFRGAFDSLWEDVEFEPFDPDDDVLCARVEQALALARNSGKIARDAMPIFFDLRPHPYQQATLDQLEAERLDRAYFRNLVVAPTGTGKTLIAAFDYARQIGRGSLRPRLLFLAHREEILRQSRSAFRHVLRDESFGELLGGGEEPGSYDYLFSTVQSFQSRNLSERLGAEYWEFAVVDEAHHVPAQSYRDLIADLRPKILLGLTATPERMDGESILPWFQNRIADEMRVWHAIERQYLVPFDYYGVFDGTDLSELAWSRGAYQISDLDKLYSRNQRRANLVVQEFCNIHGDSRSSRALGFCVSVAHAEFMAEAFNRAGIPASAVTSKSGPGIRAKAPGMLRNREVNVLFTVDLFNEGVDIPEVDCLLFLRPTESATVFIQQMGRGLRLDSGKTTCLILDFIGNQRREFRFDLRFRALFGGTRQQVIKQIESGVTRLPGNCYFRLDKESRGLILSNLKARLQASRGRMVEELKALAASIGRRPTLLEFLQATQYDLEDVFKSESWSFLLQEANLLDASADLRELVLARQFKHILHIDSVVRLELYEQRLRAPGTDSSQLTTAEQRMILMLTFRLLQNQTREPGCVWSEAIDLLRECSVASVEFIELIQVLRQRIHLHAVETSYGPEWPLFLHRQYTRDEILTAVGFRSLENKRDCREGRLWLPESETELFFVTLDKSHRQFSPTTRYEDFALSPTRFHWQSQSTTSAESATGRRYIEQKQNGVKFLLFVRPRKGDPFLFLGPLQYASHTGSRPMSIYWDLTTGIPAWFFEQCASLRAA